MLQSAGEFVPRVCGNDIAERRQFKYISSSTNTLINPDLIVSTCLSLGQLFNQLLQGLRGQFSLHQTFSVQGRGHMFVQDKHGLLEVLKTDRQSFLRDGVIGRDHHDPNQSSHQAAILSDLSHTMVHDSFPQVLFRCVVMNDQSMNRISTTSGASLRRHAREYMP